MLLFRAVAVLGLVLGMAGAAQAGVTLTIDDFEVDQAQITDSSTNGIPVTSTLGIAPFRTLSVNRLSSGGVGATLVRVSNGELEFLGGSYDYQVILGLPIAANALPSGAQNVSFLLDVIRSFSNQIQLQVFLDANQIGATAFIPAGTSDTSFTFATLTSAEFAAVQLGGNLHLVFDGPPGFQGRFEGFAFSYDEPAVATPEPASMTLALLGVAAFAARRKKKSA